jgi:hypothetical protein
VETIIDTVAAAITMLHDGDQEQARRCLEALWFRTEGQDLPIRVVIAHFCADAQSSCEAELLWDIRSIKACLVCAGQSLDMGGAVLEVAQFLASCHLNAADAARRLGRLELARAHAELASQACEALLDDGYGRTVRGAVASLHIRLRGVEPEREEVGS